MVSIEPVGTLAECRAFCGPPGALWIYTFCDLRAPHQQAPTRASATSRAEPNPISVGLPRQRHKKVQRRPPFGETERYSPPPSAAKFLDGCH